MGACTGFIFAALLEFTLTNYLWRKGQKYLNPSLIENSGPLAAAASAAASGLDPSMFTQMMSAGAVTGNTIVNDHVGGQTHVVDLMEDDKLPLTSPAHNLLKKRIGNQGDHSKYSFLNRYGIFTR